MYKIEKIYIVTLKTFEVIFNVINVEKCKVVETFKTHEEAESWIRLQHE